MKNNADREGNLCWEILNSMYADCKDARAIAKFKYVLMTDSPNLMLAKVYRYTIVVQRLYNSEELSRLRTPEIVYHNITVKLTPISSEGEGSMLRKSKMLQSEDYLLIGCQCSLFKSSKWCPSQL